MTELAGTPAEESPEAGERALRHLAGALRKLLSPEEVAALSKRIDPESPLREFVDFLRSESGTPASREPQGEARGESAHYFGPDGKGSANGTAIPLVASEGSEPEERGEQPHAVWHPMAELIAAHMELEFSSYHSISWQEIEGLADYLLSRGVRLGTPVQGGEK